MQTSKFSTIKEALQSIIPDIKESTTTDHNVKQSNNESRMPACCIHSVLIIRDCGLSPEQRDEFLTSKLLFSCGTVKLIVKLLPHFFKIQ
jgi:hypothetical protein